MFSKRTQVPYPCIVCNREELDQLHSRYQASKDDFWVYKCAAKNCCGRCDSENRRYFWERYPTLSALACCEPVTTIVQVPIPASTVGTIERAVHASMIAAKGSDHRAHGTFVSHLQLLDCPEIYKQALIAWAPKAMIDFTDEVRGASRVYREVKAVKSEAPVVAPDNAPPDVQPPSVHLNVLPPIPEEKRSDSDDSSSEDNDEAPTRKNRWSRHRKEQEEKIVNVSSDCSPHEEGEAVYSYDRRDLKTASDEFHAKLFSPEILNDFVKKHPASIYMNGKWQISTIKDLFMTRLREAKEDLQFMFPSEIARALDIPTTAHGVQVFDCDITAYSGRFADQAIRIFEYSLWRFMEMYAGQERMRKAFHKVSFRKFTNNLIGSVRKDPDVKYWVLRHIVGAFDGGQMFSDTTLVRLNMYHGSIVVSTSSFGANDLAASFEGVGIYAHLAPRDLSFTCRGMKCNFGVKKGRMAFLGH